MKSTFILKSKTERTHDVALLSFVRERGHMVPFKAGQYVTLYFPDGRFGWQGKSYSIASVSGETTVDIAVKKLGTFSSALHDLAVGDRVTLTGPTGYFYPSPKMDDLVFIAAGIGIAPFVSIVNDLAKKKKLAEKNITLLYSNKTKADIAFFGDLDESSAHHDNLSVVHFLTRSDGKPPDGKTGGGEACDRKVDDLGRAIDHYELHRIDEAALKKYIVAPRQKNFFICGSISFVNDIWRVLQKMGVPEERLATEAFY